MVADEFALEELRQAAEALATSSGRMQERLADAATFLMRVRREDISDEPLGRNLVSVLNDLSYVQAPSDEGRILATLKITSDENARAIASRIVDLYHALAHLYERPRNRLGAASKEGVGATQAIEVPAYLRPAAPGCRDPGVSIRSVALGPGARWLTDSTDT
jgi:hypothetical protein